MAKIPKEAQELFEKVDVVVFATARTNAQPNCCIVGMKKVINDETVYLSDQFFKKTLANIRENPKVSVIWWGAEGAYELYGTARYVDEGPEFTEQAAWVNAAFEQMGRPITAKGGVYIDVESVYSSSPGPSAGEQIA